MEDVREPLSRDRIVDGAIALVEREGVDALTMRRLGSTLGVRAMSLYNHVANRDELVDAISARAFEPLQELELSDDWRDALSATLRLQPIGRCR